MSKTARQMKNWILTLMEPETDINSETEKVPYQIPSRKPRRSSKQHKSIKPSLKNNIVLRNNVKGISLRVGDCILVKSRVKIEDMSDTNLERGDLYIIQDIAFGTADYLDLKALYFLRHDEVDCIEEREIAEEEGYLSPNDIFITAVLEKVKLADIVAKVKVISQHTFQKMKKIDKNDLSDTFICRYGMDFENHSLANKRLIDWDILLEILVKDGDNHFFLETVRSIAIETKQKKRKIKHNDTQDNRMKIGYLVSYIAAENAET